MKIKWYFLLCRRSYLRLQLFLWFILISSDRSPSSCYDSDDTQISWFKHNHMNIHVRTWVFYLCKVRSCDSPCFPFCDQLRTLLHIMVLPLTIWTCICKFQEISGIVTWLSTFIACNLTPSSTKTSSSASSSEVSTTPSLWVWLLWWVLFILVVCM